VPHARFRRHHDARRRAVAAADGRAGYRLGDRRTGTRRHLLRLRRGSGRDRRPHEGQRRVLRARAAPMTRRRRPLSEEERALWERVAETAEPLNPRTRAAAAREAEDAKAEAKPKPEAKAGAKPA